MCCQIVGLASNAPADWSPVLRVGHPPRIRVRTGAGRGAPTGAYAADLFAGCWKLIAALSGVSRCKRATPPETVQPRHESRVITRALDQRVESSDPTGRAPPPIRPGATSVPTTHLSHRKARALGPTERPPSMVQGRPALPRSATVAVSRIAGVGRASGAMWGANNGRHWATQGLVRRSICWLELPPSHAQRRWPTDEASVDRGDHTGGAAEGSIRQGRRRSLSAVADGRLAWPGPATRLD